MTPKKRFFDFRNLHLMGGWLVLTDSIFEEKMKIDLKMVDQEFYMWHIDIQMQKKFILYIYNIRFISLYCNFAVMRKIKTSLNCQKQVVF